MLEILDQADSEIQCAKIPLENFYDGIAFFYSFSHRTEQSCVLLSAWPLFEPTA